MSISFCKITNRLQIRSYRDIDNNDVFQLFTNPQVNSFLGASQFFSNHMFIKQFLKQVSTNNRESDAWLLFSIFYKLNHQLIGSCGLKIDRKNKEAEIFYLFLPAYWNKGLATEACKSIIDEIISHINLKRIKALILPENLHAQRVAEKIGFRFIKEITIDRYEQKVQVQLWTFSLITGNYT